MLLNFDNVSLLALFATSRGEFKTKYINIIYSKNLGIMIIVD